MIRRSTINLNPATDYKKTILESLFLHYQDLVNKYIETNYQNTLLNKFGKVCESDVSARFNQLALKTAIEVIKSVREFENNKKYKRFKKVYTYFSKKKTQKGFLSKHFKELKLNYRFKPIYAADSITFDERFLDFKFNENSFDIWVRISSTGLPLIKLPGNKHRHFNKFKGWVLKKSGRLWKDSKGNYYFDFFFETETPSLKDTGKTVSFDVGMNKLLTSSEKEFIGTDVKGLLEKCGKKKKNSVAERKARTQIKNKIGYYVNRIDWKNLKVVILEDLSNISKSIQKTKRKSNRTTRKLFGSWNRRLLTSRIMTHVEENGVLLTWVDPRNTSRTCPSCGHIDKGNRRGEHFKCLQCGFQEDADFVGALNILSRFHSGAYSP